MVVRIGFTAGGIAMDILAMNNIVIFSKELHWIKMNKKGIDLGIGNNAMISEGDWNR